MAQESCWSSRLDSGPDGMDRGMESILKEPSDPVMSQTGVAIAQYKTTNTKYYTSKSKLLDAHFYIEISATARA